MRSASVSFFSFNAQTISPIFSDISSEKEVIFSNSALIISSFIFLSVKECLHNIVKHSGATKVFLSIDINDKMQIIIHDNGKGMDRNNHRTFGNGLDNIEKRMKEIKGKASFRNDKGAKVTLSIPLLL